MEDVNTINNIASENVDFSMFALFMAADLVVKSVIIVLILASIYSWTIIVSKLLRLRQLKQMEKELYEYLLYTGQQEFYNDMMAERRAIRQARIDEAIRRSDRKRFWVDVTAVVVGLATVTGVIMGVIWLISSAG